jgi:superoxide dismutase
VKDGSGVAIAKSPNAENPLASGQTPLLTMDVWGEHYTGQPRLLSPGDVFRE